MAVGGPNTPLSNVCVALLSCPGSGAAARYKSVCVVFSATPAVFACRKPRQKQPSWNRSLLPFFLPHNLFEAVFAALFHLDKKVGT